MVSCLDGRVEKSKRTRPLAGILAKGEILRVSLL